MATVYRLPSGVLVRPASAPFLPLLRLPNDPRTLTPYHLCKWRKHVLDLALGRSLPYIHPMATTDDLDRIDGLTSILEDIQLCQNRIDLDA
jgi:hypothetical protein